MCHGGPMIPTEVMSSVVRVSLVPQLFVAYSAHAVEKGRGAWERG